MALKYDNDCDDSDNDFETRVLSSRETSTCSSFNRGRRVVLYLARSSAGLVLMRIAFDAIDSLPLNLSWKAYLVGNLPT